MLYHELRQEIKDYIIKNELGIEEVLRMITLSVSEVRRIREEVRQDEEVNEGDNID